MKAILGDRLLPPRLDGMLASSGHDARLTDEATDPDRENDRREPVAGDFGARGPFASVALGRYVAGDD